MKLVKITGAVAALALSSAAVAGPNWTWVEVGAYVGDADGGLYATGDAIGDSGQEYKDGYNGWSANGMFEIGSLYHVGVGYFDGDFAEGVSNSAFDGGCEGSDPEVAGDNYYAGNDCISNDASGWNVVAGIHPAVTDNTDLVVNVRYEKSDVRTSFGDGGPSVEQKTKTNEWGINGGVRSMLSDVFEVNGYIGYDQSDSLDNEVWVKTGGQYYFGQNFGLVAEATLSDATAEIYGGLRWNFVR